MVHEKINIVFTSKCEAINHLQSFINHEIFIIVFQVHIKLDIR
jgi:hypothetical protein